MMFMCGVVLCGVRSGSVRVSLCSGRTGWYSLGLRSGNGTGAVNLGVGKMLAGVLGYAEDNADSFSLGYIIEAVGRVETVSLSSLVSTGRP
jgi:hypothetical protein